MFSLERMASREPFVSFIESKLSESELSLILTH